MMSLGRHSKAKICTSLAVIFATAAGMTACTYDYNTSTSSDAPEQGPVPNPPANVTCYGGSGTAFYQGKPAAGTYEIRGGEENSDAFFATPTDIAFTDLDGNLVDIGDVKVSITDTNGNTKVAYGASCLFGPKVPLKKPLAPTRG